MDKKKNNMFASSLEKKKELFTDEQVAESIKKADLITPTEIDHDKKKAGRPKAKIKRKQTMFSLSEYQLEQFAKVEGKLKAEGVKITRNRSETAELALALLDFMLSDETRKSQAMIIIENRHNYEESDLSNQ